MSACQNRMLSSRSSLFLMSSIHESCSKCGKPLEPSTELGGTARMVCKHCRRRVGMCFLCHQPVTAIYVWCPGCGHGGHLECAIQWFGGTEFEPPQEVCPTGCGHKCNFQKMTNMFPRTESLNCIPIEASVASRWQLKM